MPNFRKYCQKPNARIQYFILILILHIRIPEFLHITRETDNKIVKLIDF